MTHLNRALEWVRNISSSYQQRIIALLTLTYVLDYADRALIGAIGPTLRNTFGISNSELGLLAAMFAFVGAAATIPIGSLVDKVNRTILLAVSFVIWAAAIGVVGASITVAMLYVSRLFLGAVTATTGPSVPSILGDVVPPKERAKNLGIIDGGQLVGSGIGYLLPAIITAFVSWRWSFWLLAIGGAALAFSFWRIGEPERESEEGGNKDSGDKTRVEEIVEEQGVEPNPEAIETRNPEKMSLRQAVGYVFRVRTDLIVLIGRSIGDYFLAGISTFAVVFATNWYGLSQSEADFAILALGIGAIAGVLLAGWAGDKLLRQGKLNSKPWLGAIGYILAPIALFPAFLTHSLVYALPLLIVGAFFLAGASPPLDAMRVDVVVPRLRGRSEGVRRALQTAAEGGAPLLIGLLADHLGGGGTNGLRLAFMVALPTLLINGLVLLIALRTYKRDVAAEIESTEQRHND